MLKKIKEEVDMVKHDPWWMIMNPALFFPLCGVIVCIIVALNHFVIYPFDGKTNETTAVVAVVQDVTEEKVYTLCVDNTNQVIQEKLSKKYAIGESVNGYYDGTHFLTEKQASRRGFLPVLIWAIPISIIIFVLYWVFILALIKGSLKG